MGRFRSACAREAGTSGYGSGPRMDWHASGHSVHRGHVQLDDVSGIGFAIQSNARITNSGSALRGWQCLYRDQ